MKILASPRFVLDSPTIVRVVAPGDGSIAVEEWSGADTGWIPGDAELLPETMPGRSRALSEIELLARGIRIEG